MLTVIYVSIHAPTWGTTQNARGKDMDDWFQSPPPHGGRRATRSLMTISRQFQSTPPHGGRHYVGDDNYVYRWFQSTPPHGGRHIVLAFFVASAVFQSTPPHGGRLFRNNTNIHKVLSQCFCESYINNVYMHSLL